MPSRRGEFEFILRRNRGQASEKSWGRLGLVAQDKSPIMQNSIVQLVVVGSFAKTAADIKGLAGGPTRRPAQSLSAADKDRLRQLVADLE